MKEKTLKQIENLKNQTIGVEVEMNCITRKDAARIAAEFFGTHRVEDTAYRNGYCTVSAWDAQGREWKFQKDVSIAGDDAHKCEMVTPILTYSDIESLVHIHIGAADHTAKTLRNLANLMASHESLLAEALKLDQHRMARYCRTVDPRFLKELNKKKPQTMDELEDIWYISQGENYGRDHHYNGSRYRMLNYHATFSKHTIEFRLFEFEAPANGKQNGIHAGRLKAYIQLCLALSEMAKEVRTASPKPQQHENPKFAMRTWLLRLGFIGEEFATARKVLTENLSGDTAFRFGRAA